MFLIGLTGGIAAGKSTVASIWQDMGARHIDADDLAREVVSKDSLGLKLVVDTFGEGVIAENGELDRAALAAVVFQDPAKRAALEQILHPLIQQRARELLTQAEAELPAAGIVVYSIPLLVETNSDLDFDCVVTVEAPEHKQLERMAKHRGMTPADAKRRIDAQATPAQRAGRADYILNSNQAIELLELDARNLYHVLQESALEKANKRG